MEDIKYEWGSGCNSWFLVLDIKQSAYISLQLSVVICIIRSQHISIGVFLVSGGKTLNRIIMLFKLGTSHAVIVLKIFIYLKERVSEEKTEWDRFVYSLTKWPQWLSLVQDEAVH